MYNDDFRSTRFTNSTRISSVKDVKVNLMPKNGLYSFYIEFRRNEIEKKALLNALTYLESFVLGVVKISRDDLITTVDTAKSRVYVYIPSSTSINRSALIENPRVILI